MTDVNAPKQNVVKTLNILIISHLMQDINVP